MDSASLQIQAATLPASRLPPKTSLSGCVCTVRVRNAMAEIEVYVDFESGLKRVGTVGTSLWERMELGGWKSYEMVLR
jgi:hypothetical protein